MKSAKEDPTLWPDEGYAVIENDKMKAPYSDDYMVMIGTFDNAEDVVLPRENPHYRYYVHRADKKSWPRRKWENGGRESEINGGDDDGG